MLRRAYDRVIVQCALRDRSVQLRNACFALRFGMVIRIPRDVPAGVIAGVMKWLFWVHCSMVSRRFSGE